MTEKSDKVRSQMNANSDAANGKKMEAAKADADPYLEIDECTTNVRDVGQAPYLDEDNHVHGEVQVPTSPPESGQSKKMRMKYGTRRSEGLNEEE